MDVDGKKLQKTIDSLITERDKMFIAMNRFRIVLGAESTFVDIWRYRDSNLNDVPGFLTFSLIKGEANDDYTLYASHTTWKSKLDFTNWTKSEAFRKAHKGAGSHSDIYLGHPVFEGFETVI